ncbi:relaxase/mobilization nuclease domain-containing protein [Ohtaekwangia koreensis]|uniref:Relaxase/Mobilisation nuclease domain-containing protein n=1 Tax=Ohtaekwangia koreensis TaxID=688867 RepID=A0A1T5J409_9BACT|nr:relaxase/mobilization nuclease domain-containing protein [Ohtaekwangia koreensis]SKC45973.1 Relaxase/Mobilisation nuclease domain-containing protein [Ohtaekwangia koreensis]
MTADLVKGKSFRGALLYNLEKVRTKGAKVLDTNFSSVEENAIMKEIFLVRMLRPGLSRYFYHTSLNFPPDENLSDQKLTAIAKDFLHESGFTQHQYILFRHHDAEHPHIHLLVNRIGFDGSVVSDSNDYAKAEQILRQLEVKHGLRQVPSSKYTKERAVTHDELEMMKRTKVPSVKAKLQVQLKDILKQKLTTDQFIVALEKRGINVLFNQATTGYISGISFGYQGMLFKGGSLGNDYKWSSLKNSINYDLERDRESIMQANARTRSLPFKNNDTQRKSEYTSGEATSKSTTEINLTGQLAVPPSINAPPLSATTKSTNRQLTLGQVYKITHANDHKSNDIAEGLKETIWNGLINSTNISSEHSNNGNAGISTDSYHGRRRRKKRKRGY